MKYNESERKRLRNARYSYCNPNSDMYDPVFAQKYNDLCEEMGIKRMVFWDYDKCKEALKDCTSRSEMSKTNVSAYNWLRKNKQLDKFCEEMGI